MKTTLNKTSLFTVGMALLFSCSGCGTLTNQLYQGPPRASSDVVTVKSQLNGMGILIDGTWFQLEPGYTYKILPGTYRVGPLFPDNGYKIVSSTAYDTFSAAAGDTVTISVGGPDRSASVTWGDGRQIEYLTAKGYHCTVSHNAP